MRRVGRPSKNKEEIKAKKIVITTEDGEVITICNIKVFKVKPDNRGRIHTGSQNKHLVVELT